VVALTRLGLFPGRAHSPATAATLSYVTLALTLLADRSARSSSVASRISRSAPSHPDQRGRRRRRHAADRPAARYQVIGWAAMVLVFVLRFIGGVFHGRRVTPAPNPLAMEATPGGCAGWSAG